MIFSITKYLGFCISYGFLYEGEFLHQNIPCKLFILPQACKTRLEGASFYVVDGKPFCGLHKGGK